VNGKVTLVHCRLSPALARVADRFPPKRAAAIHERTPAPARIESASNRCPDWVPSDVLQAAQDLSAHDALAELPECLRHA
jgi:hypothetical protein